MEESKETPKEYWLARLFVVSFLGVWGYLVYLSKYNLVFNNFWYSYGRTNPNLGVYIAWSLVLTLLILVCLCILIGIFYGIKWFVKKPILD